jgi:hypothetical protein
MELCKQPYKAFEIICHFCEDLPGLRNILWIFVHICLQFG